MSSGSNFVFTPDRREALLQSYRQKMKKVAPSDWNMRKFIFFYAKQKQFGEGATFADVP